MRHILLKKGDVTFNTQVELSHYHGNRPLNKGVSIETDSGLGEVIMLPWEPCTVL